MTWATIEMVRILLNNDTRPAKCIMSPKAFRLLRQLRGWTLQTAALRTGVSERSIRMIEAGKGGLDVQYRLMDGMGLVSYGFWSQPHEGAAWEILHAVWAGMEPRPLDTWKQLKRAHPDYLPEEDEESSISSESEQCPD